MSKEKKQFKLYSIKLDLDVSDALEAYCKETGMTKTAVIEKSVMLYVEIDRQLPEKMKKLKEYEDRVQELMTKLNAVANEGEIDEN